MRRLIYLILGIALLLGLTIPMNTPTLAASSGPNGGSTFASVSFTGADDPWSNPDRAVSSNNQYATATIGGSSDVTYYLRATGFGFSIPAGSTIDGIQIGIERNAICVGSCTSNVRDYRVRMVKGGTIGTTDRADTSTNWPTSDATATYGGAGDLWGTTWTVADINNAATGVVISATRTSGGDKTARVDYISMIVYYTPPVTYTITAIAGAGGTISPSGAVSVIGGSNQAFDIPPNTSYIVSDMEPSPL